MTAASEQIIDLYEWRAHEWVGDRSRQKVFIERAWLDRFCALIKPGGTVLDLGCGPGKPMAAYLLAKGFDVCGVDSSPTMISLARVNFSERQWIIADMRTLALRRDFDGVMAWDSLFHLDHASQRKMFPIFGAHARLGAPLLFTSGPHYGESIGSFRGEALYHASLAPEEYRSLLGANGFSVIEAKMEDMDCGGHSVWLARRDEDG